MLTEKRLRKLAGLLKEYEEGPMVGETYQDWLDEHGKLPSLPNKVAEKIVYSLHDLETETDTEGYDELHISVGQLRKELKLKIGDELLTVPKGWYYSILSEWGDPNVSGPFNSKEEAMNAAVLG